MEILIDIQDKDGKVKSCRLEVVDPSTDSFWKSVLQPRLLAMLAALRKDNEKKTH